MAREGGSPRSRGGAADEAGGQYRRALAALFVAHSLNGIEFYGLPFGGDDARVESVALETDAEVDDILVGFRDARVFVQAKRRLRFGRPLDEVADQWLRAVRSEDFDVDRDFVAVGSGEISAPLRRAAGALERRNTDPNAVWTSAEAEQVTKLKQLFKQRGASDDETDRVLARAIFIQREVEEDHHPDADRARLLLDGHVVSHGEGGRAWRELVAAAGRAARLRIGHTASGWLDELRRRGVPLTEDAEASRAAALEEQRRALERFRERLGELGTKVDLTAVGARLPLLPLSDLDAMVTVRAADSTDGSSDTDLLWAFRRRGRVLLTGLPGGGKTTALRAVAGEWAKRSNWAIPIPVSLRRLAERERFRKRPLRDDLLDLASEVAVPKDRLLVRMGLDEALTNGDAVLFLDGLDEAADRSLALAADINKLLEEVHPETDVLLATRDAAYADASILGFRDLVLNQPGDPNRTVRALLMAIAEQRHVPERATWVDEREEWVRRALEVDRQLSETPLLPILLTLLAAENVDQLLPTTRAKILADVIQGVVERHEINRELEFDALPKGHEADALLGAFPRISRALSDAGGSAPRSDLVAALKPYLESEWNLAPAPARKTSGEILRFWDESGIFVARGNNKATSPRLRLFLEIGAAMDAAARPDTDAPKIVAALTSSPDRHETLVLAAGISRPIADALIADAVSHHDEPLTLAAARALAQGGTASQEPLRALIEELIELMKPGDDEAWRTFTVLVRISIPEDLRERVLAQLECFPQERVTLGRALAALEWNYSGKRRAESLEAGLRLSELPRLQRRRPREGRYADLRDVTVDRDWMRVKIDAATELLPHHPELAPAVADAMEHASMAAANALAAVLIENGHDELAETRTKRLVGSGGTARRFARESKDLRRDVERTLEVIGALAAPADLTRTQSRRLHELACFIETLDLNHGVAWIRFEALERVRVRWYQLIASLGRFDVRVLAAEAGVLREELAADQTGSFVAFYSLFDVATAAPLEHWQEVSEPIAERDFAVRMLGAGTSAAGVSARALVTHPNRKETAAAINARLPDIQRDSKRVAVWAALHLADDLEGAVDGFASSEDEAIRESVASLVPLTTGSDLTAHGRALVTDAARRVQLAALKRVEQEVHEPSDDLVAVVERVAETPPQPFKCYRCGADNGAERDVCHSCSVVTESPSEEARRVLGNWI